MRYDVQCCTSKLISSCTLRTRIPSPLLLVLARLFELLDEMAHAVSRMSQIGVGCSTRAVDDTGAQCEEAMEFVLIVVGDEAHFR